MSKRKKVTLPIVLLLILVATSRGYSIETKTRHHEKTITIESLYRVIDVDHIEKIESIQANIYYIRSIIEYHEFSDEHYRERYGEKAATYVNGIYRGDGNTFKRISEILGEREANGFGKLHKIDSGGGQFNELVELKTYYNNLHGSSRQFIIELVYSPYRGNNTTLIVYNNEDFTKPIINITSRWIMNITKIDNTRISYEINGWPKDNYIIDYAYDEYSREYRKVDITSR